MKVAEQKEWLLNILKNKDIGSIDEFLAKGGKIDINLNNAKQTILALAVSEDDIELSKVLINKGANVNSLSHSGHPIISSVKSLKMAQLLVESGADLTILSKKGENILHYLISSQNTVLVKYLCQQMGDVYSDEELKSVEPMDETGFWNLIGKHYQKSNADEALQAAYLVRTLMYETPPVIIAFQKRLWQLINLAHTSDLWAAAFVINGGCSDDAFMDFKHWLVSIGKSGYYNALKNPDGLIKFLEKKASFVNYTNVKCDNLAGVAEMAYRFRTLIGQVYQKLNTMEKLVLLIGKPRNLKD